MAWLKKPEAAKRLGVSLTTMDRLIAAGALPAYRMTDKGSLRISEEDLTAYLEKCRVPVTAPAATRRRTGAVKPGQKRECWYKPGMKIV